MITDSLQLIDTFSTSPRRKRLGPRALSILLLGVAVFGGTRTCSVAAAQDIVKFASAALPSGGGGGDSSSSGSSSSSSNSNNDSSSTIHSPMPSPFDNTPASAFQGDGSDDSCPKFMSSLLSSSTFKSCYPLSMMLQTSTSFFQAEKSLVGITRVLDTTCKANSSSCTEFFDTAASNLTSSKACKKEYDQNQTLVIQAYRGLRAYNVLYAATCLQSPDTDQYCFADAVTNPDAPSDNYLYFLPYGLSLPNDSNPSCDWCTQQTMAVYHAAAADRQSLISNTYQPAAKQINDICGSKFLNNTLPPAASSLASVALCPAHLLFLTVLWTANALS